MRCWMILILVVVAQSPSYVECQEIGQNSEVSYEGENVAVVELVTNPNISVEFLRPLVQQQADEPYSKVKVESTISALRGTGRFSKVEVDVKPDPAGLHVTFTLEPAFYFGIFEFPGAAKAFSYTRLLQVVDIPDRTPYKQDLVSQARENLQQFFASAGYFQAQVQPEGHFDETHMLANVLFHVDLGRRARLGNVQVQGTEPTEAERLLRATRSLRATVRGGSLKPGKPYTPKRIDSGVALMRRDLVNQHHLAGKVGFDHPEYHKDSNRANLIIDAQPGSMVNVRITGANLSPLPFLRNRQMKKLIPIFSEGTVDPDLVEEGRRNLIDFFQSKGYFDAEVTTNLQNQASHIEPSFRSMSAPSLVS